MTLSPAKENLIHTSKGTPIIVWKRTPEHPVAALHILHGMMEHSARYEAFAEWLAAHGVAAYAADHPGHGKSVENDNDLGHINGKNGWDEILEATRLVQDQIRIDHPDLPVFLLGHSFGSAVARSYVQGYGQKYPLAGLILSGCMQQPTALLKAGLGLIALQKIFYGNRHRSKLMIALGYGQYAKPFKPNHSPFDWLSSVREVVDMYDEDPLCGYACSLGYYRYFFKALIHSFKAHNIRKMDPEMPVLFLGGSLDPAIRSGKDTRILAEKYKKNGTRHVEVQLYPSGRHEMLNEVNREKVYAFIMDWIDRTNKSLNG